MQTNAGRACSHESILPLHACLEVGSSACMPNDKSASRLRLCVDCVWVCVDRYTAYRPYQACTYIYLCIYLRWCVDCPCIISYIIYIIYDIQRTSELSYTWLDLTSQVVRRLSLPTHTARAAQLHLGGLNLRSGQVRYSSILRSAICHIWCR